MLSEQDDREIEKAVEMMVAALARRNRKNKPVIMHSLRVALYLYGLNCDRNTVIGGVLHDTVEASDLTPEQIEVRFGEGVRRLVEANSNIDSIADKTEQYRDTFRRCIEAGKDALMIKGSDLLDNTVHSYSIEKDPEKRGHSLEKVKYFLDLTAETLAGHTLWDELNEEWKRQPNGPAIADRGVKEV